MPPMKLKGRLSIFWLFKLKKKNYSILKQLINSKKFSI